MAPPQTTSQRADLPHARFPDAGRLRSAIAGARTSQRLSTETAHSATGTAKRCWLRNSRRIDSLFGSSVGSLAVLARPGTHQRGSDQCRSSPYGEHVSCRHKVDLEPVRYRSSGTALTHRNCAGAHIVPTQHLRSGQVCPSGAPVQVCTALPAPAVRGRCACSLHSAAHRPGRLAPADRIVPMSFGRASRSERGVLSGGTRVQVRRACCASACAQNRTWSRWCFTPRFRPTVPKLAATPPGASPPSARLLTTLRGHPFEVLLCSGLRHPTDQIVRNRFIERKPEIAFLSCIERYRLPQLLVSLHWRINADVPLEGGKIDECAVQGECWHLIANLLLCPWYCFSDRRPDFLQNRLNLR